MAEDAFTKAAKLCREELRARSSYQLRLCFVSTNLKCFEKKESFKCVYRLAATDKSADAQKCVGSWKL